MDKTLAPHGLEPCVYVYRAVSARRVQGPIMQIHADGYMKLLHCSRMVAEAEATDCARLSVPSVEESSDSEEPVRSAPPPRHQSKLLWLWRFLSLRGMFNLLGRSVGMYPYAYIIASLLIASNSFGMYFMVLKDRIRDGYTPTNAPSRYETDVIREFWNSSGDPMVTAVLLTAKDGGSMLRQEYMDEAAALNVFLMDNYTIEYKEKHYRYRDVCTSYCKLNTIMRIFHDALESEKQLLRSGLPLSESTNLTYPVVTIGGFTVHLERLLFGVNVKEDPVKDAFVGRKIGPNEIVNNWTNAQLVTNMESVRVVFLLFRGDKDDDEMSEKLALWETTLYKFSREEYNNSIIDMQVIGTEILDAEMIRDGQKMTPFFAAGFGFMMLFVIINVLLSSWFYDELDVGKGLVALGASFCPILAISTTYGLISLFGLRTNSFMLVMPFLIMGIGVDDAFLMLHAWQKLAPQKCTVVDRLGMLFEEVGPSITITSLTNFISFGIGAFTPTPEIRMFCMATAIAMGLDYILQLIMFGPILAIASKLEKVKPKDAPDVFSHGWRAKIDSFMKWILKMYCRIIANRAFTAALIVAVVVYWYFAIYGALNIQVRLDAVKILPKDSPIQKPNQLLTDTVWKEYHPVTILVNRPFNIGDAHQLARFDSLVHEFESLPKCKGSHSTILWVRDYKYYFEHGDILKSVLNFLSFDDGSDWQANTPTGYDYSMMDNFLASPFYEHYKSFVKLERSANKSIPPMVTRFWLTVAYENTSSWEDRIDLMTEWRTIASRYSDLNATVWEANGMFVDQMLSLKTVALQTGVLTLICMAVVCAVFIPNPCSVVTASVAIASISLGVFGFLSWWHFDLDPVTMAAVLMSIGMSVDFTAHVSYHYQLTNRKEYQNGRIVKIPIKGAHEKLEHTLQQVGWPMIQAGLSTIVCVLPLLFLQSYSPIVFLKTIFLVVAWGLLHGLVVLPAFLGSLPICLTNLNCYRTFLSSSSQRSCRYQPPNDDEYGNELEPMTS
uniref:SSD domain-containing protein n=1 Tax=Steinernema glaseri TaxID=37863 RepID=A0A1I8ALK1_9BILA